MKNLVFILQRNYETYNIPQYGQRIPRMVAVLGEPFVKDFPEELKPYFARLYTVPLLGEEHIFSQLMLSREAVSKVIEDEIEIAGGAEQLNIVCSDEFNLLLVGWLRDHYGIPGAGAAQYDLYRDKNKMKHKLAEHNIRVPHHCVLDTQVSPGSLERYYLQLTTQLGGSFVVKPISGASSIHTLVIHSQADFIAAYSEAVASGLEFGAEEFIEGTVYHCESIIQQENVLFSISSEYLFQNIEYGKGKIAVSLPLPLEDPLSQRILSLNQQVISVLGYIDGLTHFELFNTPQDELVVIEIAARSAGAEIIPNFQLMLGLQINAIDMRIQAGEKMTIAPPKISQYSIMARIPNIKGKVVALQQPNIKSHCEIDWQIKPGDVIERNSASFLEYAGVLRCSSSDYQQLKADFEALRNYQPYTVEPF